MNRVRVAAAVIRRDGLLLLTQRPPGGPLGMLWEFPGGKIEPGETPSDAVARELGEELGVEATAGKVVARELHEYDHGLAVEITFIECTLAPGQIRIGPGVHALRWVRPAEVDPSEVLEADRAFLAALARAV